MSTFKDFITSSLSDFTTPAIRRPVEDIIYETLDRRQVPTRTDFHELRDIANGLRGQISSSTQGIKQILEAEKDMMARIDEIEQSIETLSGIPDSKISSSTATVPSSAKKEITSIQQQLLDLSQKIDENHNSITKLLEAMELVQKQESNTQQGVPKEDLQTTIGELVEQKIKEMLKNDPQVLSASKVATRICTVPGCTVEARAKGFCNPHYQQWRRKTLLNFVTIDNEVIFSNGKRVTVDKKFSAKPYEEKDGSINIDNGSLFVRVD